MTTIDHTYYPDIVDSILRHAPRETLVRFRATSRAYRARIDAQLSHVRTQPKVAHGGKYTMFLTSPRDPARPLPFIPAAVRVLDLHSDFDPGRREPERLVVQFTRLHTLRRLRVPIGACPRAPVVVDVLRITENSGPQVACQTSPLTARHVIHAVLENPPLTAHLDFEPRNPWLKPEDPPPPRDYVLVYHFLEGAPHSQYTPMTVVDFAVDLFHVVCDTGGSLTVVGAEKGLSPGLLEQIQYELNGIAREAMCHLDGTELPPIRFLGLDQWRAELGDRCELEGYAEL